MIIEQLIHFQYVNKATTYFVKATEYTLSNGTVTHRLTTIDGEITHTIKPGSRSEALRLAEAEIGQFVARMHLIYSV